jgi:uncharacterized protein
MLTEDEPPGAPSNRTRHLRKTPSFIGPRGEVTPVSTTVWVAGDDGRLLVQSDAVTWKVKRTRHDSHVRVAPCGATKKVRGEAFDAEATILADTALVEALEARKYGLIYRVIGLFRALGRGLRRRPTRESVSIEIVLAPASASRPDGPSAR